MNTDSLNKKLLLQALVIAGLLSLAILLVGCWAYSPRKTAAEPAQLPGAGAVQFAPVPRQDLEQIYHDAWLALARTALDQNRFSHWSYWEHKFDGQIRTRKQLKEALTAMVASLGDHYMSVMAENDMTAFEQTASGKLVGVGVTLNGLQIVSVLTGSPAEKSGLAPGDVIAYVDNHPVHPGDTQRLMQLLRGSGQEGSKVVVIVMRDRKQVKVEMTRAVIKKDPAVTSYIGRRSPFMGFGFRSPFGGGNFAGGLTGGAGSPVSWNPFTTPVRALTSPLAVTPAATPSTAPTAAQPAAPAASPSPLQPMRWPFNPSGRRNPSGFNPWDGGFSEPEKDKTGAIRILNPRSETIVQELDAELKKMEDEKMEGIVLDLRNVKGGSALTAAKVAALFLASDCKLICGVERVNGKDVTIVYELKGGKLIVTTTVPGEKPLTTVVDTPVARYGKPVFVVVDNNSCGASELIAAALKGNKRATVFGVTTRGKLTGQSTVAIGGGFVLRVTVSRYSGPDGKRLDAVGVVPDLAGDAKQGNLYGQAVLALRDYVEKHRPAAEAKPGGNGSSTAGESKSAGQGDAPKGDAKPAGTTTPASAPATVKP